MGEQRRYERVGIQGLEADVSDGVGCFPGVITDISRFGMLMTDLPKRVDGSVKRMTVVVSGHGKNFKMLVRPQWSKDTGLRQQMGFQILSTPWEWTSFVMKLEPKNETDVWGVVNL